MVDIADTLAPKSDQLTADDLIAGPRTITITRVTGNEGNADQPVNIFYEGDGGNPFRDEQLPQAVIALKQGVGRLIRSEHDRGVLVLCDPRVRSKPYGEVFITSLPPMPITRDVDEVETFFARAPDAGTRPEGPGDEMLDDRIDEGEPA